MTRGQERALQELWPTIGVEHAAIVLDLDIAFGRVAPRVLEIGFGNGDALVAMAMEQPDKDFVGIEVHRPGVGHLLLAVEKNAATNVRVFCHDAVEVLSRQIADAAFERVNLYFPDPWPKKRHHKRRIVQRSFVDLLAQKITPGGLLHLATDWQPYAEHMLEVLTDSPWFDNLASGHGLTEGCVARPVERPLTKFEQRGHRKGHGVWDIMFRRRAQTVVANEEP